MGGKEDGWGGWPPAPSGVPPYLQKDEDWTHFDNSVNAVSFGFVATAILISMFLIMAIFEKFLSTTSPGVTATGGGRLQSDIEAQNRAGGFNAKLGYPSPKVSISWIYYNILRGYYTYGFLTFHLLFSLSLLLFSPFIGWSLT